jgi:hypothetical protein
LKKVPEVPKRKQVLIIFSLDCRESLGANTVANLEAARSAFRDNFDLVVFTGGIFNADKGQTVPAARLMRDWWFQNARGDRVPTATEEESVTTRQNIAGVVRRCEHSGFDLKECDVFVVSERWHLMGISYLFRRLYGIKVSRIPSAFRESPAGIRGRLIRLVLYRLDPHGTGWLSRRKIKERGG